MKLYCLGKLKPRLVPQRGGKLQIMGRFGRIASGKVLAHGGRGWAYEVAGVLALARPNVWIEISGLPPRRLPEYFARFDLARLAERFIFGTDWPGVPGIRANAQAVIDLGLDRDLLEKVLYRNALAVYGLELPS